MLPLANTNNQELFMLHQ